MTVLAVYVALREADAVFLLFPKVASTSIRRALRMAVAGNGLVDPDPLDYVDAATARGFSHRICFVRHPLDRLASLYAEKFPSTKGKPFRKALSELGFSPGMSFEEFIETVATIPDERADSHFRSQAWDLMGFRPTRLGRLDNVAKDWLAVQILIRKAGGPELPMLTHMRQSDRSRIKWSLNTRALAIERYAADLRWLGHEE